MRLINALVRFVDRIASNGLGAIIEPNAPAQSIWPDRALQATVQFRILTPNVQRLLDQSA